MIFDFSQYIMQMFANAQGALEKLNQTAVQETKANDEPQIFETYFDETKNSYYCATDGLITISEELYR